MDDSSRKTNRRSIRLRDYDYAQAGMYFLTICSYRRQLLFGHVVDGVIKLNKLGEIVCDEWRESANIRCELELDAFIVMPNHVHGIVGLKDLNIVGATGRSPSASGLDKHSLGALVAGFKSAVAMRVNRLRGTPKAPIWQRNYYEHVIRDEESLSCIREYIVSNPAQWDADPENPGRSSNAETIGGVTLRVSEGDRRSPLRVR
ncbi:MAG TPA: transposase [Candidatus Binatia bacterium]